MAATTVRAWALAGCLGLAAGAGTACDVNIGEGGGFNLGVASGRASDEWVRTYTLAEGGRLEVRNQNGPITVEPATGAAVEVRAERIAKASTDEAARELLQRVEIQEDVSASRVRLETKGPQGGMRTGHEVRYVLRVPASVQVEARTTNGGIKLNGVSNHVVAATVNGGVQGEGLSGRVEASTTNGGVRLTLDTVSQQGVTAEAVNGGVDVSLPRDAKADISARVANGGVRVDDSLGIEIVGEKSRRRLDGRLNGGGARLDLSTTNGGVSISAR